MDWFSIIKIDENIVERSIEFVKDYKRRGIVNKIIKLCGREIWLGSKISASRRITIKRDFNKNISLYNFKESTFINNFVTAGAKIITSYKVPSNVKSFLNSKDVYIKHKKEIRIFDSIYPNLIKFNCITYNVNYSPVNYRSLLMTPEKTGTIRIFTELFSITVYECTIDDFIMLSKNIKPVLPSLRLFLIQMSNWLPTRGKIVSVTNFNESKIRETHKYTKAKGKNVSILRERLEDREELE